MLKETENKIYKLSQENGGIQINLSKSGVKVSTRDTPGIVGVGIDIDEAVYNCWEKLLIRIDDFSKEIFYFDKMSQKKRRLLT
jgi:hypothetical protein